MKHVKKSVLLWYSAREIYDLVTAVADYPRFLPWCDRAEVLESHADGMTARLHLNYHGVRHAFTTRNTHVPGESVLMAIRSTPASENRPVIGANACSCSAQCRQPKPR